MQIPIINGIYTSATSDFRTSYPRNLIPVAKQTGATTGYLRPADGIELLASGVGRDRGAINWDGVCYRVQGSSLISVDLQGVVTTLGDVGDDGNDVSIDYSFDRLAIVSAGRLWYYKDATVTQVMDNDLGFVRSVIFVDGYFMLSDSQSLLVTDLTDPTSINPLKYGSAEVDPDIIQSVIKIRNEPIAIGRYTCEFYQNIGGTFFPFQRVNGASISKGAIGPRASTKFLDMIAMVGSGRNEPPQVLTATNGQYIKISTREIDQILQGYTPTELSNCVVESRIDNDHAFLLIHLPDQTLVYDASSSTAMKEYIWFTLDSGKTNPAQYKMRNLVWLESKWVGAAPTGDMGTYTLSSADHYGELVGWNFATQFMYNEGRGAVVHELELITLSGRAKPNTNPTIWTSYSVDGVTWSLEQPKSNLAQGQRLSKVSWLQQGLMRQWRVQRFRGFSDSMLSVARLEARLEPLNV